MQVAVEPAASGLESGAVGRVPYFLKGNPTRAYDEMGEVIVLLVFEKVVIEGVSWIVHRAGAGWLVGDEVGCEFSSERGTAHGVDGEDEGDDVEEMDYSSGQALGLAMVPG